MVTTGITENEMNVDIEVGSWISAVEWSGLFGNFQVAIEHVATNV